MAKRTLPTPHGTENGYKHYKCRCDDCRAAHAEAQRQQRKANPDAARARRKRWSDANPDYARSYQIANRETILARQREWRESNRQRLDSKQREYYRQNRDKCLEYSRMYAAINSEAAVARARQWAEENPERVRESARNAASRRRARKAGSNEIAFTAEQLEQRMAYYGNRCYLRSPGCTDALDEIDHVKPLAKLGPHMLANLRPACKSCNRRKSDKWPFDFTQRSARDSVSTGDRL